MTTHAHQFPEGDASFAHFFTEVHGFAPFRWQEDLAAEVIATGKFPDLIDLPTGAGKTSVLDIALFAMAQDAGRPAADRRVPRRIVYVVDRRLIVDQVNAHGQRLLAALNGVDRSRGPAVAQVARSLDSLKADLGAFSGPCVQQAYLRGGITRDEQWATRPDVPTLITSTVDQVGSRLLFRGYGIAPRSLPVHAGLLASDCLFILDEVHLSPEFADTLASLHGRLTESDDGRGTPGGPRRWDVLRLSATPHERSTGRRFPNEPLTEHNTPDSALRARLTASKPVELKAVAVPGSQADRLRHDRAMAKGLKDAFVNAIERLANSGSDDEVASSSTGDTTVPRLGVVVTNRVSTAVAAVTALADEAAKPRSVIAGYDVVLITGRMRPFDRDALLDANLDAWTVRARRAGDGSRRHQIIVATQCIEAGVDMDVDVMVSECASLDALRQRFGRLDRKGHMPHGEVAQGAIVLRGLKPVDDPIYGSALAETWNWLNSLENVDFGISAMAAQAPPPATSLPGGRAPLLTGVHLDALVQTSPAPAVGPVVSRWLHGDRDVDVDVQVVWRDDIDWPDDFDADKANESARELTERIRLLPPRAGESVSVPISAVRHWLSRPDAKARPVGGDALPDVADVDTNPAVEHRDRRHTLPYIRIGADDTATLQAAWAVRPGDTVIVPSRYGGLSQGTWSPSSDQPVVDVANAVAIDAGAPITLRLNSAFLSGSAFDPPSTSDDDAERIAAPTAVGESEDATAVLTDFLDALSPTTGSIPAKLVAHVLRHRWTDAVALVEDAGRTQGGSTSYVITTAEPLDPDVGTDVAEFDTGAPDDTSSITQTAKPVRLSAHLRNVGEVAARFALSLGYPSAMVDDLRLAGHLHDLGKTDPRFQVILGNDAIGLAADALTRDVASGPNADAAATAMDIDTCWAKSVRGVGRRQSNARSAAARYPRGQRHELVSAALVRSAPDVLAKANDPDLVLYLVLSHHGFCRPFAPPATDAAPIQIEARALDGTVLRASTDHGLAAVSSFVAPLFWSLVERYGHFALAQVEALFRTADQTHSAMERDGKPLTVHGQSATSDCTPALSGSEYR